MTINITNENITLAPKNIIEEIIQNITIIATTIMGEIPLDRKFGINGNIVDSSTVYGKNTLTIALIESIQDYEPRAEITNIDFNGADEKSLKNGIVFPKLEVRIKDEYIY